jgi:hypothetical protein
VWEREGGGARCFVIDFGGLLFSLLCFFSDLVLVLSLFVHAEACHLVTLVVGGGWCIGSELIGVDWGWSWSQSLFMSVGRVYVCLSHIAYDDYLLDEGRTQSRIKNPMPRALCDFQLDRD